MTDIKSMTQEEMAAWLKELGEPAFRAKQVFTSLQVIEGEAGPRMCDHEAGGGAETGLRTGWHDQISLASGR